MRHPHTRGGSCSSRWGNQTTTSSRFFPRTCSSKAPLLVPLLPPPLPNLTATPPQRQRGLGRGIDADPNSPSRWVCFYLQENDRVPEWWREFQLLIPSLDESFGNVPVQRMTCQQAMAFRLPATQLEWDGSWTTPPCLGSLEQRDFLPLKDFKGAQDYWVVWAEETVALAKALQRCAVHSGMPPGVLCGAVTGTLWVPHLYDSEWWPGWPWNVRCGWEGPHGPCLWRESTAANAQGGPTCQCNCP